jgi:uncharacterized protein
MESSSALADRIETELRSLGTPERAAQEKRYLKSDLEHLGVTVPAMRKMVLAVCRAHGDWRHDEVVSLARALWKKPIHERRAAAIEVLTFHKSELVPGDVDLIERFLRQARGWALVDSLAASVVGDLVERFPKQMHPVLDRWAKDNDFWLRRSALLALLLPLRRGEGDFARFGRYADVMLEEREFFIRKAIGWVLRESAKKTPKRVVDWLLSRAARASGLTLREASKPLPAADKARLLSAHGKGGPGATARRLAVIGVLLGALCAPAAGCAPASKAPEIATGIFAATARDADAPVVVSQIYGGGSNASAPWQSDFVELFNRSSAATSIDGWSVQYASATGTGLFSSNVTVLSGTLQPGQYYLVAMAGGSIGAPLPTPDAKGKTAMSATAGKLVLCSQAAGLACNGGSTPCDEAAASRIVDLVGYGSANFFEAAPVPALSNTTAALRASAGCHDSNDNAADFGVGAPTPRNSASPLQPCAADTAPVVAATVPARDATNVSPNVVVSIKFSEPVTLDDGAFSFSCSTSGTVPFALACGPDTFTLTPAVSLVLGETCTVRVAAGAVHDADAIDPPDTMASAHTLDFSVVAGPGQYRIHDVQGHAHLSPLLKQIVTDVPGVVTVVRSDGFYLQDPEPDQNDATSEAVFVYTIQAPAVAVGDQVLVTGQVEEYRPGCSSCSPSSSSYANLTTTEISQPSSVAILSHGKPLPPPVAIGVGATERHPPTEVIEAGTSGDVEATPGNFDPAVHGIDFYESLEGMRVSVSDAVVVGPTAVYSDGSRELAVLAEGGLGATGRTSRGGIGISAGDRNPERIILADGPGVALPDADVNDLLPGSLVGVMDYSFGNFKLVVSELPTVEKRGLSREILPLGSPSPAELTVATLNAENLSPTSGSAKFAALAAVVVNHLGSPDLVALEEIQDNSGAVDDGVVDAGQTLALLKTAILAAGGPAYDQRQIDPENDHDGGEAGGNIRVVFLFRADRGLAFVDRPGAAFDTPNDVVNEDGAPALRFSPGRIAPTSSAFANSRKPLAAAFRFNGRDLFVIANHFNSKGGDQPLFGRFQPPILNSETQRLAQAQVVASFVAQVRALDAAALILAMGDFNDFEFSPPLSVLKGVGLSPLIETLPPAERYTYVYEGNSQTLDHILVSPPLLDGVRFDVVHVNAELMTQTSDHDPSVARFVVGVAPQFTSTPETEATQAQAYSYDVHAEGTPAPTYALAAAPSGMTIDTTTGRITWTPEGAPGSYAVVVRAHNGVGQDALQTFDIVVSAAARAKRIVPTFECVERDRDGSFVLRFGYHNPNPFVVEIPVGFANQFFPWPADREQPVAFAPGEVHDAFRVKLSRPAVLVWELDGRLALASTIGHGRCP